MKKTLKLLFVCTTFFCTTSFSSESQVELREREAERYLSVASPEAMLRDLLVNMTKNSSEKQKRELEELLLVHFGADRVEKILSHLLVKYMTREELKALADFYSTPHAKSSLEKFGQVMAEAMPLIQQEMLEAQKRMKESHSK